VALLLAILSVAIWLYLLLGRGLFWRAAQRDDWPYPTLTAGPRVAVVVPARNEADSIGACVSSLVGQVYPGEWTIMVVDDDSSDGTAERARDAARHDRAQRLHVVRGQGLPSGWTGKLWAQKQGIDATLALPEPPDYLLLTDADIVYGPDVLARLVARAQERGLVLTSLMVKLRCESFAERSLIPAFVFFFQMLYPFAWVDAPENSTAAAAGGCMLVRADALRAAGGIETIRNALIDDCALAAMMKAQGPISLALTERVKSIRPYPDIAEIRRMVSRSAYAQLNYSRLLLAGTVIGMAVTYLAPPLLALFADGAARLLGFAAWIMMAVAFLPTVRFYRLSPAWAIALPAIALAYLLFTLDSAWQFARGKGGLWKGRVQASRA
jgi:hopene-associated glycosyltransferase HpnB